KGGFRYWVTSLLASILPGVITVAEDRDAPAVVARRGQDDHVLQRTGTYGQALRARDRFQKELDQLGEADFCRRYGLSQPPPTEH
ncbi:MAG: hypothetical protein ACRDZ7_11290, partial [Acidimicrobiia bacterium]